MTDAQIPTAKTKEIHFTVDGEHYETDQAELTPNQIIREFGHLDPATHYLVQIKGHERISYQGQGDTPIELHDGMQFQVIATGPTPVSDMVSRRGVGEFVVGLCDLGYEPRSLPNRVDHIYFDYEVPTGGLAGRKVRLGLIVPQDFPEIPPSGPHVSPHIHPINPSGAHPTGGVHHSHSVPFEQGAGGQWQYWSRPFPNWATGRKSVSTYMSHIWRLWDSQ